MRCVQLQFFYSRFILKIRDNIWMLSQQFFAPDCGLDFSSGVADTISISCGLNFFLVNASICDTQGQILFYTDGQWIAYRNDDTLLNSDHFNPGWATDTFYSSGGGLGFVQGAIAIPNPGNTNQYYLFYITAERWFNEQFSSWDKQPLLAVVDPPTNNFFFSRLELEKQLFYHPWMCVMKCHSSLFNKKYRAEE
ncbi:MAG: hypothetical protein ABIQ74_13835 [Chitinophagales bacterium]